MSDRGIAHTKGILHVRGGEQRFGLSRRKPADDVAYFVKQYWIVRWDLDPEASHKQETLPDPCVNLVVEHDRSGVFGVVRRKFARVIEGAGWAIGAKFRPGGFFPFARSPVHELTDASVPLVEIFGSDAASLEDRVRRRNDEDGRISEIERFLRECEPEKDPRVALINRIVERIETDPSITAVADVLNGLDMSARTLQRLFRRYVGVGPKWVIQRYRLQEAADFLARGGDQDWPQLALELGYYDQAHFINDFTAMIGTSPAEYAKGAS